MSSLRQELGAFGFEVLAKGISDGSGKAFFIELEVTDQSPWDAAVQRIRDEAGGLHILMNIVGSNALVMLPEVEIEAWNKMFEVNVTATLIGMQTCAPLIKDAGGGSIVNIGSVAGITGKLSTAYSASKWALEGLSRSAAYIYSDWGIRCNALGNERSHQMLTLLKKKDDLQEKKEEVEAFFTRYF